MKSFVYTHPFAMTKLEHNMSAGLVELNYARLLQTAAWAVRLLLDRMDSERNGLHNDLEEFSFHSMILAESRTEYLSEYARALEGAMDTYHALLAMQERQNAEIVNRPEIGK